MQIKDSLGTVVDLISLKNQGLRRRSPTENCVWNPCAYIKSSAVTNHLLVIRTPSGLPVSLVSGNTVKAVDRSELVISPNVLICSRRRRSRTCHVSVRIKLNGYFNSAANLSTAVNDFVLI